MIQLLLKDLKHNQRKEAGLKMGHDAILIKGRIFEDFLVNFIQLISLIASNANRQPSLPKANSFRNSFSFFSDCVVIIFCPNRSLKRLFPGDLSLPSVQTANSSNPYSNMIFRSSGFSDCCSFSSRSEEHTSELQSR